MVRSFVDGVDLIHIGWQTVPKSSQFHRIIVITSAAGITTASAGWRSSISPVTITAMDAPKVATFKGPHFTADNGHCIKVCVALIRTVALHENGFGALGWQVVKQRMSGIYGGGQR